MKIENTQSSFTQMERTWFPVLSTLDIYMQQTSIYKANKDSHIFVREI